MSRHFGQHKARLLEATVTDIHTGKKQEGRRAMLTMATAPFRWSFPPAWGDSLRTLTDIQRETVFVSVEKVTRMRGSRGGPLPEVGPHGVGVGDAKGRAKGKQDVGDPERDAGVPATPTPVGAACTVNSRNPLQRRRAISMLLSPPDERDKMRTHPNCHNCHRLPPTVTNTHGKNTNTHGKSTNTHSKNTGAHGKNTGAQRRGVRRQSHQRDWLRCAARRAAQTTRARTHAQRQDARTVAAAPRAFLTPQESGL